jgi:hypothetical protein
MNTAVAHVVLLLTVTSDPSSEVVARAAVEALKAPFNQSLQVVLRLVAAAPDRPQAAALTAAAGADAVVVLTCTRPGCARADLRVAVGAEPTAERTVRFGSRDELAERGRAIGLLASTVLPDAWSRDGDAPTPAREAAPDAAAPVVPAMVDAEETSRPAPTPRWAFETTGGLFGGAANGVSEVGLTLAAQRALLGRLTARIALKLELGETPGETGVSRGVGAALGIGWTSAGLGNPGHFGIGARADAIALERRVRLNTDTQMAEGSALALGCDAVALVGLALSPGAALLAGVGAEILGNGAFGSGDKDDDRALRSAAPAQFRLITELGILARF